MALQEGVSVMPPVNIMLKPVSGTCNLHCRYCFYADEAEKRKTSNFGKMSYETLENIISKVFDFAEESCTIGFQGGEPTLAGIDFYRRVIALEKKYNRRRIKVHNSFQTNGLLLNDEWAEFFADNHFLVGVSVDGYQSLHDFNRIDNEGKGTHARVMEKIGYLAKHGVDFNILCVVTAQMAKNIGKVYRFFKKQGLLYQQYIPCLDPLGEPPAQEKYSLTPKLYGQFLKSLFDLWYKDVKVGEKIYIGYFENLLGMMLGQAPESCGLSGVCSVQNVVEADGGIYPCDFYMLDDYKIGNLNSNSMEEIYKKREEKGFIQQSFFVSEKCYKCNYFSVCRNGCRRNRLIDSDGNYGNNYFCDAFYEFFGYAMPRLKEICRCLRVARRE